MPSPHSPEQSVCGPPTFPASASPHPATPRLAPPALLEGSPLCRLHSHPRAAEPRVGLGLEGGRCCHWSDGPAESGQLAGQHRLRVPLAPLFTLPGRGPPDPCRGVAGPPRAQPLGPTLTCLTRRITSWWLTWPAEGAGRGGQCVCLGPCVCGVTSGCRANRHGLGLVSTPELCRLAWCLCCSRLPRWLCCLVVPVVVTYCHQMSSALPLRC